MFFTKMFVQSVCPKCGSFKRIIDFRLPEPNDVMSETKFEFDNAIDYFLSEKLEVFDGVGYKPEFLNAAQARDSITIKSRLCGKCFVNHEICKPISEDLTSAIV